MHNPAAPAFLITLLGLQQQQQQHNHNHRMHNLQPAAAAGMP